MAKMFPEFGPKDTGSYRAEPDVYWRLSKQLPDDFYVIHSLPWLSAAAKEIDNRFVPTGEIDFLIFHHELGVLALEVKGGAIVHQSNGFAYKKTGQVFDPVTQVRRGTHGLAEWLRNHNAGNWRIGYAVVFPNSETSGRALPPALVDMSVKESQKIVIDIRDLKELGARIIEIMQYWKKALGTTPPGRKKVLELKEVLLPDVDYSPYWLTRISHDTLTWLQLTPEQLGCLNRMLEEQRFVVNGLAGTGKTLLAVECARKLSEIGKHVLFLTHNVHLTQKLKRELQDSRLVEVCTRFELCRRAANTVGIKVPVNNSEPIEQIELQNWYQFGAVEALRLAIEQEKLLQYDALIVDEGQVIQEDWWIVLSHWFKGKKIIVCCDYTQVFEFEKGVEAVDIAKFIEAHSSLTLTLNLRSPKAVFEKLQQIHPTDYQQLSLRYLEEDALEEIAVSDPEGALQDILWRLKEERIPKEAIIVLYTDSPPPKDILAVFGVRSESIGKYRGMESPVVIVWAQEGNDINLQCAYTRATSRCIAIFPAHSIAERRFGKFGKSLLESDKASAIQKEAALGYTSTIIQTHLQLRHIELKTVNLFWSDDWCAWLIFPNLKDEVADRLWAMHISLLSNAPVYFWAPLSRGQIYRYSEVKSLNEEKQIESSIIRYCDSCDLMTPFESTMISFNPPQFSYRCRVCLGKQSDESFLISQVIKSDNILAFPYKATPKEKMEIGACLVALARWRKLTLEEKREVLPFRFAGKLGFNVAKILTAVDIVKSMDNDIVFSDLSEKYFQWCVDLGEAFTKKEWHQIVSYTISGWLSTNHIYKIEKGIYKRNKTREIRNEISEQIL